MLTYFTILVLILLFLLLKMFVVVPMREAAVIERLGKFRIVLNPGFHFLIPFFDRIAYLHESREQVIDIPSQGCITRDNIQVEVDGLVYIQVLDPKSASYGIEDYRRAAINLAQTTMRAEIGKLSLGESFYERDALNETIVKEIDKASDPWGIKVLRYELKNITPSANVIHTLERQMEAEREKRAEITRASAEKEATINIAEGNRQEDINLSEGEKQRRINVATGRAEAISILAEATAEGTEMIAAAVQKEGGSQALKMQLIEEYIETLTDITTKANVSIVPLELAKIKGFFDGLSEVADSVPSTQGRV
ncbi:MAG TPA: paraslipin [Candidatus Handelsmanbacteria bacterium]|nr:paraslipin [Candidatus Handelsmanbacteria bacterium]